MSFWCWSTFLTKLKSPSTISRALWLQSNWINMKASLPQNLCSPTPQALIFHQSSSKLALKRKKNKTRVEILSSLTIRKFFLLNVVHQTFRWVFNVYYRFLCVDKRILGMRNRWEISSLEDLTCVPHKPKLKAKQKQSQSRQVWKTTWLDSGFPRMGIFRFNKHQAFLFCLYLTLNVLVCRGLRTLINATK